MTSFTKYVSGRGRPSIMPGIEMPTGRPSIMPGIEMPTGSPVPQNTGTPMSTTVPTISSSPITPGVGSVPQYGLLGAESAINTGLGSATGALNTASAQIASQNSYTLGGGNAARLQADLSGANGPDAARIALGNFNQSPAAQYQLEQSQRAIERSAAARGGLLGGNVLRELQANAAGIAAQDFNNQFANLGSIADRGANVQLSQDGIKAGLSRDIASAAMTAGINTAGLRTDAGNAIANNAASTASQISQLLNQQGVTVSDFMAKDISTIADIIYQSGLQQSLNTGNLAAILANIAGQQGSTIAEGQSLIGAANAAGTIGIANSLQTGLEQAIDAGVIKK